MKFSLKVNGKAETVDVDPTTPLLYVLRNDLGLLGPRFGCGLGQCGACTVIIKGEAVRSCIRPMSQSDGVEITTLEGLAQNGRLHPVQQAFLEEGAMQCGYCVPGMVLRTAALLEKQPKPTEPQVREALDGSLCRCCAYSSILAAVQRAAGVAR